jgi:hypothetical protein
VRGEFIGVWSETWREIWLPLIDHERVPEDIFCELYRELARALKDKPSVEALADVIDNPVQSREAFEKTGANELGGERALVAFLETAHAALDELAGDELSNRYFNLLASFIDKFSLRYDLRRPCTLSPTLPGIFAGLIRDVERLGRSHPNIARRLRDFNEAIHDLRLGQTEGRISTCIAKQVMLLESLGGTAANVSATELAGICKQIESWPHSAVRPALLGLYGFASDYSGVRHGTESDGRKRDLDTRDLVALSVLLVGFAPYLSDAINADHVYRGA